MTYSFILFVETPGCIIYFTTDGQTPKPYNRFIDGVERTFKYKGPFKLRPGTRIVTAIAFRRHSLNFILSQTLICSLQNTYLIKYHFNFLYPLAYGYFLLAKAFIPEVFN